MLVSSCALLASANASHSGISPCVEDSVYSLIDLGIAVGTGALIVTDDETMKDSPGLLAVPGVFLASTVLGVIGTHRCRNNKARNNSGEVQRSGTILYQSGAPAPEPKTNDEDTNANDGDTNAAAPSLPKNPLRLSEEYQETILQESCDESGTQDCPEGYDCITTATEGRCVPTEKKERDPMGPKSI